MGNLCSRCGAKLSIRNSFMWNDRPVCSFCLQHYEILSSDSKSYNEYIKLIEIVPKFSELQNIENDKILIKIKCTNCGKKYRTYNPTINKVYHCTDCGENIYLYHLDKKQVIDILKNQHFKKSSNTIENQGENVSETSSKNNYIISDKNNISSLETEIKNHSIIISWEQIKYVWWSIVWRNFVYGVIAGMVLGYIGGIIAISMDSPEKSIIFGSIAGFIGSIPTSMLAIKQALSKHLLSLAINTNIINYKPSHSENT